MKKHELKTHLEPFEAVASGVKAFEYRKNDRDFQIGDILELREYLPEQQAYTGRILYRKISYILDSGYGLPDGYCILSIQDYPLSLHNVTQIR